MKIEIELPDWVDGSLITILAGIEQVAYKNANEDSFNIKTSRCSKCGDCCVIELGKSYFPVREDKSCIHLVNDGRLRICDLNVQRPWSCCTGDQIRSGQKDTTCSIRYSKG